jgi:quinol monooxygenase YgiN
MITRMLHIRVRPGFEQEAIDTLSAIERHARQDTGIVNFAWLRDEQDLTAFTLFEQWRSQADLDRHQNGDAGRWERLAPGLAGPPRPESFRPVSELAAAPGPDEVGQFVRDWFTRLGAHAPAGQLLAMLLTDGLVMELPDATLAGEADFRKWHAELGSAHYGQSYEVEHLEIAEVPGSLAVDLELTVLWTARRTGDGAALAYRSRQSWRLARCARTGQALIARYQVREMTELPRRVLARGTAAR